MLACMAVRARAAKGLTAHGASRQPPLFSEDAAPIQGLTLVLRPVALALLSIHYQRVNNKLKNRILQLSSLHEIIKKVKKI